MRIYRLERKGAPDVGPFQGSVGFFLRARCVPPSIPPRGRGNRSSAVAQRSSALSLPVLGEVSTGDFDRIILAFFTRAVNTLPTPGFL